MKQNNRTMTAKDQDPISVEEQRESGFTLEDIFGSVQPIPGTSEDFDSEIEDAMAEESLRLTPHTLEDRR